MTKYLIAVPHAPDECLRALEAVLARGPEELARYDWSCGDGDHTGYAVVQAGSRDAVAATIPAFLLPTARIVEVCTYTPEQVRTFDQGL